MIAPGIRVVRGPDWIWQNQGKILTCFWLANETLCTGLFLKYTFHYAVINMYSIYTTCLFILYYFHSARVNESIKLTVKTILFLCVVSGRSCIVMRIKSVNNQISFSHSSRFINRTDILGLLVIYIINMI